MCRNYYGRAKATESPGHVEVRQCQRSVSTMCSLKENGLVCMRHNHYSFVILHLVNNQFWYAHVNAVIQSRREFFVPDSTGQTGSHSLPRSIDL